MTPLSGLQVRVELINVKSGVAADLHSGVGYKNILAQIESACTFKLRVNCLM